MRPISPQTPLFPLSQHNIFCLHKAFLACGKRANVPQVFRSNSLLQFFLLLLLLLLPRAKKGKGGLVLQGIFLPSSLQHTFPSYAVLHSIQVILKMTPGSEQFKWTMFLRINITSNVCTRKYSMATCNQPTNHHTTFFFLFFLLKLPRTTKKLVVALLRFLLCFF